MNQKSERPRKYDAVVGDVSPPRKNAAATDALQYGKPGVDLLKEIVSTETGELLWVALNLLWGYCSPLQQQQLRESLPELLQQNIKGWNDWRDRCRGAFSDRNTEFYMDLSKIDLRGANLSWNRIRKAKIS